MNISLVSIAFNGYGKWIPQFLAFYSNMSPKPKEVVIVLGRNHGCDDIEAIKEWYPEVKFIEYDNHSSFGQLRNIGIKHTTSEWTWFVSVDDKPMPDAIETFKKYKDEADYICSQWYTIGIGQPLIVHKSPTPEESAKRLSEGLKMGFIIPHSPFKRELWEKHNYKQTDLPNYDFLLHCVLNGARFVKADKPTTTYLRRNDSHSKTTLKVIKRQAVVEKNIMQHGVLKYYKNQLNHNRG